MNKRVSFFILSIFLLAAGADRVSAFTSVSRSTLTAVVSFTGSGTVIPEVPQIYHWPIDRISPLSSIIIATGTVSDNTGLSSIEMDYYYDTIPAVTTRCSPLGSARTGSFRFEVKVDTSGPHYFYYRLRVTDISSNVTVWPDAGTYHAAKIDSSSSGTVGASGGTITLSDGNADTADVKLIVPSGALASDVTINVTEVDPSDPSVPQVIAPSAPVAIYQFTPEGLVFDKMVELVMPYTDADNDGIVDGTTYRAQDLTIMWWDGFSWRLIGGRVDLSAHTVSWEIKHFSIYGLFAAPALSDNDYRPKERIITPAHADGVNDVARFNGLASGDTVRIFDVTGRQVRELKSGFEWDGRDSDNHIVESGIYVYQIKTAGKTISGTIAVAK